MEDGSRLMEEDDEDDFSESDDKQPSTKVLQRDIQRPETARTSKGISEGHGKRKSAKEVKANRTKMAEKNKQDRVKRGEKNCGGTPKPRSKSKQSLSKKSQLQLKTNDASKTSNVAARSDSSNRGDRDDDDNETDASDKEDNLEDANAEGSDAESEDLLTQKYPDAPSLLDKPAAKFPEAQPKCRARRTFPIQHPSFVPETEAREEDQKSGTYNPCSSTHP